MARRLLSCCILLFLAPLAAAQNPPDPAELARIETAIANVRAELAATRSEQGALLAEMEDSERAILDLRQQLATRERELASLQEDMQDLQQRQQTLNARRQEQQALIGSYLKSAWMAGNEEYLKLLLNQEDPRRSARVLRYYQYFNAARAERLADYRQTLAELDELASGMARQSQALERSRQALAAEEQALAEGQQQRQAVLARLEQALQSRGTELARLEQEKVEIERLLEELRRSIVELPPSADLEAFTARRGRMPWPLQGRLANDFGTRHALGDLTWEGITIAAEAGSEVRAIHHGRVVFADWFNSSGLLVIIDHGEGYMSLYAHNQELFKEVGDWVSSGEAIAAAGNTGGRRDNGLYFELRRNGRAENPVSWLQPR